MGVKRYSQKFSKIISPKEQVNIQSLQSALDEKSELVSLHFSKLVDSKTDTFAAFNTAFWRDGVFIRVPDDTLVEKPIVVLHIHVEPTTCRHRWPAFGVDPESAVRSSTLAHRA